MSPLPFFALVAPSIACAAEDASSFYSGKTIAFIVGSSAGGGYDAYARLLERHYSKHIPGHPGIVVQYIPGGGGLVAANTLYNLSPKDGTAIALLASSSFLVGALGEPLAKFDNAKFTNIGNITEETDTCSVWNTTGVKDYKDFLTKPLIVGTAEIGSNSQTFPAAMNHVLGSKFKFIQGYQGSATLRTTAMESGGNCKRRAEFSFLRSVLSSRRSSTRGSCA